MLTQDSADVPVMVMLPLQTLPAVDDHPLSLLYDGHALWLLAGGKNQGALFQLDPQSGATVNRLDIPASVEGDVPVDITFDGHNLWVLTVKQLVRISLPALNNTSAQATPAT